MRGVGRRCDEVGWIYQTRVRVRQDEWMREKAEVFVLLENREF